LNKQGRSGEVPVELKQKVFDYFKKNSERSFALYQELNEAGVARELARSLLPVNIYTEWYWKNDLHNLLHFIGLRSDGHAQYEIRVFSDAMAHYVKEKAPFAWEAYQDYVVHGMRFSRVEQGLLEKQLPPRVIDDIFEDIAYQITATLHKGKPRNDNDLYPLYQKQGGSDSEFDFKLKWESGEIEIGNIRELREFREKLESLKP
jgi:thymidylate synthase ThyX